MKIDFTNLQDIVKPDRQSLRRAAKAALKGAPGCYSLVLVDDAQIREINLKYLGSNDVTDVIAFPFEDAPLSKDDCAGEIIISAERAAAEAAQRGIGVESELALYVVHGALHLVGFDDLTADGAAAMHRREKEILRELGYDADKLWKRISASTKA